MITISCLHAALSTKSYGSEKRFLCPPPIVHLETPRRALLNHEFTMMAVTDNGDQCSCQKMSLEDEETSSFSFKKLHVGGAAKTKSFRLELSISHPERDSYSESSRCWAAFESAPVIIASRAPTKTISRRNMAHYLFDGGPVSLFNRVNSQSARTKFMTIHDSQLCWSGSTWSPFEIHVVKIRASTAGTLASCLC